MGAAEVAKKQKTAETADRSAEPARMKKKYPADREEGCVMMRG